MLDVFRKKLRRKWIEKILISLSQQSRLVRKIIPPRHLYPVKSYRSVTHNRVTFRVDLNDEIGHSLYFSTHCNITEQFLKLIKRHSTVVDVGAHIGTAALLAAATTKSGRVYAYESNQDHFNELTYNLSLNQFKNITAIKKALGKTTHTANLIKPNSLNPCPTDMLSNSASEFECVDVTTLDDEVLRLNIAHVDLIRIDAQGNELNMLLGAKATLQEFHPVLVIKFIDKSLKNHGRNATEAIHFIKQLGYSCLDLNTSMPLITGLKTEAVILCYV